MSPLLLALPSLALAGPALAPRVPLPRMELHAVSLPDRAHRGHLLRIKLRDEVRGRATATGEVRSEAGADLGQLQALLDELGLTARPTIDLDPARILSLQARAEARTGRRAADLRGMLTLDGLQDGAAMVAAGHRLQALDVVEYAYVSVVGASPPGDIGTTTSDYSSRQGYLDVDPGVDAWSAWELGLTGASVRVSDVEYGWILEHEDLVDVDIDLEEGESVPAWVASYGWDHHGTAVLGELVAPDNGYGVTGAIYDARAVGVYPEYTDADGSRRPAAIASAAADSEAGDLVLLDMQTVARPGGDYCPAETDPDVYTVVETAVDAGVVVVGAAGNGAEDLDSGWYALNYLSWGDSGAIIVGAGSSDTLHEPLYFTTHGERVNVQAWGEDVTTLGYGDLAYLDRDKEQSYTRAFSGTSSASPIVTGAAALVQDHAILTFGEPLSPEGLRAVLMETGVPQTGEEHIGPLPDVIAAVEVLDVDEDGVLAADWGGEDCDDADPAVYGGAGDTWYDGVDGDCAGDSDYDADGDGQDSAAYGGEDCDDAEPAVYSGAEDVWYDGVDGDCAGDSDYDADGDGQDSDAYGGEDCDDADPAVYSGAEDVWYDGVDGDCAGDSDYDADGDGQDSAAYGGEDCDDAEPGVYAGAAETWYDGVDGDCAGDGDFDADGDGQDSAAHGGEDCDDADPAAYSGGTETWYDGVDGDCAGDGDFDADGDGQDSAAHGGEDCDDADPAVYAGASDPWYDGVDGDCAGDSDFDADGDGQDSADFGGEDCDDTDPGVYAGAEDEPSDGIDQDCDGEDAVVDPGDGGADGGASDGGASDGGASDGGASDGGASDGGGDDAGDGYSGGKGCSSAPGPAGLAPGLLVLGVLGLRRRRPSRGGGPG